MSDAKKLREAVTRALCMVALVDPAKCCGDCHSKLCMVDDALAAIHAAGFRIVPEVPTETMVSAGARRVGNVNQTDERQAAWVYQGMLAAAPKLTA